MTSHAILRSLGIFISGVVGTEAYSRYNKLHLSSHTLKPKGPTVVVVDSQDNTNYFPMRNIALLGTVGAICWTFFPTNVSRIQFKKAVAALTTQIQTVSGSLAKVKQKVLERFGVVEHKLDEIERTILSKTASIKKDIATIETMICSLDQKVSDIHTQTTFSARGMAMLCGIVSQSLDNTLENRQTAIDDLKGCKRQILQHNN